MSNQMRAIIASNISTAKTGRQNNQETEMVNKLQMVPNNRDITSAPASASLRHTGTMPASGRSIQANAPQNISQPPMRTIHKFTVLVERALSKHCVIPSVSV